MTDPLLSSCSILLSSLQCKCNLILDRLQLALNLLLLAPFTFQLLAQLLLSNIFMTLWLSEFAFDNFLYELEQSGTSMVMWVAL